MVKGQRTAGSETELVERIRRLTAMPHTSSVMLGIGDDCAIYRPRGGTEDLLFTTDMMLEGAHFRRETHRAEDVGWKALARGLSDIAAMGGAPRFCLLSLALPVWANDAWVDGFYRGLMRLARRERTALIGGDLARAGKLMCDIVVCGAVVRGTAMRRDRARAGDAIYVSGALGGSALGLAKGVGAAWRRHARPEPRLSVGQALREMGVRAAMDLSDGLSVDLPRMCEASRLKAEISAPPIHPGASLEQALHGGEDYELLFTAPQKVPVPRAIGRVRITRIGTMRKGSGVELDGVPLPARGWDHFRG